MPETQILSGVECDVGLAAGVEVAAALLIACGALEAMVGAVRAIVERRSKTGIRKDRTSGPGSESGSCLGWSLSWLQTLCAQQLRRVGPALVSSLQSASFGHS